MQETISPTIADQRIHDLLPAPTTERCGLSQAAGRVLQTDVTADRDFPPFDRVMMDGFAIRRTELAAGRRAFNIALFQQAGTAEQSLPPADGSAAEVMTGAVCPVGADCIVPVEHCRRTGDRIEVDASFSPPSHGFIHRRASDHHADELLLGSGTRLGPAEIAVAATCGFSEVDVARLPRIGVCSTGDEVVPVDTQPAAHQIRSSNRPSIEAALTLAGNHASRSCHLPDQPETLKKAIEPLLANCDILIFTGGISKGRTDYLPGVLTALGAETVFHGVAQRPGKPMGLWRQGNTLCFALPGNPVSTLVALHRYVLPTLLLWSGSEPTPTIHLPLAQDVVFKPRLTWFAPVTLGDAGKATPCPLHNSGDLAALAAADGFLELPAEQTTFRQGESFPFYPWIC